MTEVIEQIKEKEIEQGKEKRNVPKLRFRGFEDEWTKYCFFDCVTIRNGQVSPLERPYCDMPHIGPGNIEKYTGRLLDYNTAKEDKQISGKYLFDEYDIIYGKINPQLGKVVFPQFKGLCSADAYPLKVNRNIMVSYFLFMYLQTQRFSKYTISVSMRSGMPKINREELGEFQFKVPSLQEQKKIAVFFTLIDRKIEKQSEKVEALKTYQKGIIQKIFKQEIRFKDENGREYPEWGNKKINEIFILTRGEVIAKTAISDKKTEIFKYPVYSSQTTNKGILGYDAKFDFSGEYLTWTTDGANAGKVFKRKGEFRCTNVCGLLVEKAETKGFANNCIKEILDKATPRHVSYVGNPKLMNNVMGNIRINIPCLSEQSKIAEFLTTIDEKIEKEEKKLDELKVWKKGLLQKMFI